eukprot:g24899.t1
MNIQSLYTCVPQDDGLKALRFFFSHRSNQSPSTDTLIRLVELVLTLNNFSFDSSHFLQTKGMAVGTSMGPSYRCLFVGFVEQSLINNSREELEQFINFAITFHLALKFTWTISDTSFPFLDFPDSMS